MIERIGEFYHRAEVEFRKPDSKWAKLAWRVSSLKGPDYINSGDKRALDLIVGIPLAAAAAPTIAVSAGKKFLEDGQFPFYVQGRLIDRDHTQKIIKLRTMVREADKVTIAPEIKQEDDPRVTKWGKFLRRHHIDEMPQLFQVVKGDLSLVGPRPMILRTIEHFKKHWSEERFNKGIRDYESMKKGVTGLDQVFGNGKRDNGARYHFQRFYRENASLGLDLYILWRTIEKVIRN